MRGSVRGREAARGVGVRTDGIGKSSWDPAGARILRNLTSLIPVGNRAPLKKTRKDVVHKIITHDGGDRSDPMNNKGRRGTRGYERGPDWGSWDIPGERAIVVDARVFRARKRQERGGEESMGGGRVVCMRGGAVGMSEWGNTSALGKDRHQTQDSESSSLSGSPSPASAAAWRRASSFAWILRCRRRFFYHEGGQRRHNSGNRRDKLKGWRRVFDRSDSDGLN